jgi:hypothetical protein
MSSAFAAGRSKVISLRSGSIVGGMRGQVQRGHFGGSSIQRKKKLLTTKVTKLHEEKRCKKTFVSLGGLRGK